MKFSYLRLSRFQVVTFECRRKPEDQFVGDVKRNNNNFILTPRNTLSLLQSSISLLSLSQTPD